MIERSEIQRVAASLGVDPQVIDQDYALGCFLNALVQQSDVQKSWYFKGGTALAKCHFPEYRFSEDLDFTVLASIGIERFRTILEVATHTMQEQIGIRSDVKEPSVEIVEDEYGKETYEGKTYYQGIWMFRGDPRAIRVHITRDEIVVFPPIVSRILHRYSDATELASVMVQSYALEEVFAEKLRAFSGQRRYAVARDLFDLDYLSRGRVETQASFRAFRKKCAVKGRDPERIEINAIKERKGEYEMNWQSNLEYLLPNALKRPFEEAWDTSIHLLEQAKAISRSSPSQSSP